MKPEVYYQRIGSVMRDNQFDRFTSGHRSGKLGHKLYKVTMGNERVFDRREERKHKNYNVVMMIDESGSMGRGLMRKAAESAVLMSKGLDKNGIRFCLMGFNRYVRMHKHFDEKLKAKDYKRVFEEMYHSTGMGGGCNHDYIAVRQIEELVRGLDPAHTIVLMFVDGHPACDCGYEAANIYLPGDSRYGAGQLKVATTRLAKRCCFITFGFWHHEDHKSKFPHYPNVIEINSVNQFMTRSLYALQSFVQRG